MQCARCGTMFEGQFCPRCGAPAISAPIIPQGWPCPRCGTLFLGNYCPRCGLPIAAWAYRPAPTLSGGRSILSILWTIALVGFIAFAVSDFAGLVWSPTLVVPGIQLMAAGQTGNSGVDFPTNWTPDTWSSGSVLSYQSVGGNTGGYLDMTLFGSNARGFWTQPFRVHGSPPYAGSVRLDVRITGTLNSGRLLIAVDSSNSTPDPNVAVGRVNFTGPVPWTTTERFRIDSRLNNSGVYYLKIAFIADSASGTVDVGFDNIQLTWTTNAGVFLYVPIPEPYVVFQSQNQALFLSYYAAVVAAVFLAAGYHLVRERKEAWNAFKAPLQAIGTRLKSRSAWIALAQVWMAVTFFQIAFILLVIVAGINPTSPINIDNRNAWVWLFDLANAGVYEELVFRVLLIGVPMAIGSIALRTIEGTRREGNWKSPGSAGRHVAGGWRYLFGGVVRRNAPKETLVASWAFLIASATIFGLAHAPGWGWWKALPAAVAGLGFGYLFLRHGIGAAILAHFVNDYALSLTYEGIGGFALETLLSLLFLGLAIAGAGFFAWYVIVGWRHLRDLVAQFRPPRPAAPRLLPGPYPPGPYAPTVSPPAPISVAPPAPNPNYGTWAMNAPPPGPFAVREGGRIPRDYTPTYVPPPYGYPPVRFQCPSCGWVEARYEAGRFTCTRCNRVA